MSRQIIRAAAVPVGRGTSPAPGAPPKADDYFDRIVKLIPGETVAFYITLHGLVMSLRAIESNPGLAAPAVWSALAAALLFNIPYMWVIQKVKDKLQLFVIEMAVVVWAIAVHGTLLFGNWDPVIGSIILVVFTAVTPMVLK